MKKIIQIKSKSEFMCGISIWETHSHDIYHEGYDGFVNPEMPNKQYVVELNENNYDMSGNIRQNKMVETIGLYHKAVGIVTQKIEIYGWMFDIIGDYSSNSVDEIIKYWE